jgi:secreted trypsin-like serine protease
VHESYNKEYNEKYSFDLALIKLDGPVPAFARPLPVAKQEEFRVGDAVTLAGYGDVAYPIKVGNQLILGPVKSGITNTLNSTVTTIVDIFTRNDVDLRDDMFFYGLITFKSADQLSGACAGDSGGPMLIDVNGRLKVVGIGNGGWKQCDSSGWYTNLDFYREWLLEKGVPLP